MAVAQLGANGHGKMGEMEMDGCIGVSRWMDGWQGMACVGEHGGARVCSLFAFAACPE